MGSRARLRQAIPVLLLVAGSACDSADESVSGDAVDGDSPPAPIDPDGGSIADGGTTDAATLDPHDGGIRDAGPEDGGVEPGGPGMPCTETRICAEGLRCIRLSAEHTVGYCAPTCTELHRGCGFFGPGVHAECTFELDDGTLVCGFVCVLDHGDHTHDYTCPSGDWGRLRCERRSRRFNHRYCAPLQE